MEKEALDRNKNNVADADEMELLPPAFSSLLVFNADGTGALEERTPHASHTEPLKWTFINNNTGLLIHYLDVDEEFDLYIETLTATDAVLKLSDTLKATGEVSTSWAYLKKEK